jgi:hypothetical protein
MVFGALAGGALGVGLAFPTGLLFGQGYGLGVRQGYNSYRPSQSSRTNELHTSLNPMEGSFGAGMLSAEEMVGKKALNSGTGLQSVNQVMDKSQPTVTKKPWTSTVAGKQYTIDQLAFSKKGNSFPKELFKSHEEYQTFMSTGKIPVRYRYRKRYKGYFGSLY